MIAKHTTYKTLDQFGLNDLLIETPDTIYPELQAAVKNINERMTRHFHLKVSSSNKGSFASTLPTWMRHRTMRHHSA